jgi:hypothetical protein
MPIQHINKPIFFLSLKTERIEGNTVALDVRGSVLHSMIHKKNQQDATVYQNFISYLHEAQHVSGDTPPIIRTLKLH